LVGRLVSSHLARTGIQDTDRGPTGLSYDGPMLEPAIFTEELCTWDDVCLEPDVNSLCVSEVSRLAMLLATSGVTATIGDILVESEEGGSLCLYLRVQYRHLGSVRVPVIRVGPMYWQWKDDGDEC